MTSRWKDIKTIFHLQLELPSSDLWFESYVNLKFSVQDSIVAKQGESKCTRNSVKND